MTEDVLLDPVGIVDGVISEMKIRFEKLMPSPTYTIVTRPLRLNDPERTVSMYLMNMTPVEDSVQIGQAEPTLNRYAYRLQNLVLAGEEEIGRRLFAVDAKTVRAILYRDTDLRLRLFGLEEKLMGTVERIQKISVRGQSFLNNELRGRFVYIATTDVVIETEITRVN